MKEELSKIGTVDFHLWLFILTLGLGGIGLASFLDKNLTPEWRERLVQYLRSGSIKQISTEPSEQMKPWQIVARSISLVFRDVLQASNIARFLKTSIALSLLIILTAFIYFYFQGEEVVRSEIASLFASQRAFFLALCVPLIATMVIDVLAAYQTIVFLEMIGNCRRLWQVVVLTYSNILVSIGLFSLIFPFVIVFLLIVENQRSHLGTVYLQPLAVSQQDSNKETVALSMLGKKSEDNVKLINESIIWVIKTRYETEAKEQGTPWLFIVMSSRDFDTNALLPFGDGCIWKADRCAFQITRCKNFARIVEFAQR